MLFEKIGIINENYEYQPDMYVGTLGNRIVYVDSAPPKEERAASLGGRYDGRNRVLMPGFYNAHGHSPMVLMRGYGENLPLDRWLSEKIYPFESRLYGKAVYWGTLLAAAESIKAGIVSTTDMYDHVDDVIRAVSESGVKVNIGRGVLNFDGARPEANPTFKEMKDAILMYDGFMDGRVRADASLHAEYTSDERTARAVAEAAREYDVNIHVHVSETQKEVLGCMERRGGRTPVRYLYDCGLFDMPATAAHCVVINDEDRDILADCGVTVASCPASNLKLASGVCEVQKLYDKGVNVAIGTDGAASNNSLNFLEEMKLFALLGKYRSGDAAAMAPDKVLCSASRAGALSQRRADCGLIKEGYRADLVAVDVSEPEMHPLHDMRTNIIYSASGNDVALSMVDGEVLYMDGEYTRLDVEKVKYEAEASCKKVLALL